MWLFKTKKLDFHNVGRNDPCPCGSGKKFKKCHFGKAEHKKSTDRWLHTGKRGFGNRLF